MEAAAERRDATAATAATAVTAATAATAATAVTAATALPAAATAATVTVQAGPASREERWSNRLAVFKQLYRGAGHCDQEMTQDEEAVMIRHCLQSLHMCDFERLDWNSGLLPRLFRVLGWPHQPTAARLFKAPPEFQGTHLTDMLQRLHSGTRAVAPEDMEEAVRLVEFHLLQLAYDVIQSGASSNGQQDSSPGLRLLDQARVMLLAEVAAMEENNRDQADVTFLGEHRLYTRGGRPVVADPASE